MKALRIAAVAEKTGMAVKTIHNWVAQERFPRPFKLGRDIIVWDEEDIDKWLFTKKQESQNGHGSAGKS